MIRLFVGLEVPLGLRPALQLARGGVEGAHWQRDDQFHMTLAFIGEVEGHVYREIIDTLGGISFTPFELAFEGVGVFGKPNQPKALWAGVRDPAPIIHLHEKIAHALERIGVTIDQRRYKPHVTIARFGKGSHARVAEWLSNNELLRSDSELVSQFVLFSSRRTSEGGFYAIEERFGHDFDDDEDEGH